MLRPLFVNTFHVRSPSPIRIPLVAPEDAQVSPEPSEGAIFISPESGKPRLQKRAPERRAKSGWSCTAPCWSAKQSAGRSSQDISETLAAPRDAAAAAPPPPALSLKTPPPRRVHSPAQAPPPRRHSVPAGARACTLIPRLPAPAATLAPRRRCRCRATGVSFPLETPFAFRAVWPPRCLAESDAPGPLTGVPWAKRSLARCGGDILVAGVHGGIRAPSA